MRSTFVRAFAATAGVVVALVLAGYVADRIAR
jgi:hypothetical protein